MSYKRGRREKRKRKKSYSKLICSFELGQFILVMLCAVVCSIRNINTDIFTYLIPASASLAAIGATCYSIKAKSENLSKQKIRNVYLKLFLEEKLSPSQYDEITDVLENIDEMVEMKLTNMLENSISEESQGVI